MNSGWKNNDDAIANVVDASCNKTFNAWVQSNAIV